MPELALPKEPRRAQEIFKENGHGALSLSFRAGSWTGGVAFFATGGEPKESGRLIPAKCFPTSHPVKSGRPKSERIRTPTSEVEIGCRHRKKAHSEFLFRVFRGAPKENSGPAWISLELNPNRRKMCAWSLEKRTGARIERS